MNKLSAALCLVSLFSISACVPEVNQFLDKTKTAFSSDTKETDYQKNGLPKIVGNWHVVKVNFLGDTAESVIAWDAKSFGIRIDSNGKIHIGSIVQRKFISQSNDIENIFQKKQHIKFHLFVDGQLIGESNGISNGLHIENNQTNDQVIMVDIACDASDEILDKIQNGKKYTIKTSSGSIIEGNLDKLSGIIDYFKSKKAKNSYVEQEINGKWGSCVSYFSDEIKSISTYIPNTNEDDRMVIETYKNRIALKIMSKTLKLPNSSKQDIGVGVISLMKVDNKEYKVMLAHEEVHDRMAKGRTVVQVYFFDDNKLYPFYDFSKTNSNNNLRNIYNSICNSKTVQFKIKNQKLGPFDMTGFMNSMIRTIKLRNRFMNFCNYRIN